MLRAIKISQFAALLVFVLILSGCAPADLGDKLKEFDEKVGQKLDRLQEEQQEDLSNIFDKGKKPPEAKDLTREQKEGIDGWLEKNNLNRYGDSTDMMYAGGTPLFNEATGESIDRYDYILKNHPNLLDELGK
ncbi:MAG: hypothetical protein PHQ42_03900 [Patescibacteria group bacterium]|nr:hypothetical protein [Patescibacteria group bacterium]